MSDESVERWLLAAWSPDWDARVAAVRALVDRLDDPRARRAVITLFADFDDTAVTEAALEALVARGDSVAVEVLVKATGHAGEETTDHLVFFMWDMVTDGLFSPAAVAQIRGSLASDNEVVRAGAAELLDTIDFPNGPSSSS